MNLSVMRKDWLKESKPHGHDLLASVNRGTYSQEDVNGFFADVKSGLTKNQAARNNNIPKGSAYHIFNSGVIA